MAILNIYLILLAGMSLVTFAVWGIDKAAAVSGSWRVPEKTLIGMAFLGGGVGAGLGMVVFHHKTRKPLFQVAVPAAVILQVILLVFLLWIH